MEQTVSKKIVYYILKIPHYFPSMRFWFDDFFGGMFIIEV